MTDTPTKSLAAPPELIRPVYLRMKHMDHINSINNTPQPQPLRFYRGHFAATHIKHVVEKMNRGLCAACPSSVQIDCNLNLRLFGLTLHSGCPGWSGTCHTIQRQQGNGNIGGSWLGGSKGWWSKGTFKQRYMIGVDELLEALSKTVRLTLYNEQGKPMSSGGIDSSIPTEMQSLTGPVCST